jgi:hypothetical protein
VTRLHVFCEGRAEASFARDILTGLLPRVRVTPIDLGGGLTYERVRSDIWNHLATAERTYAVTTMIDLFGLHHHFPGLGECNRLRDPLDRVAVLEERLAADIGDLRFVPYLQLHEFEALFLADARSLAKIYPHRTKATRELARRVKNEFRTPEHVNRRTPPSHHILQAVPEYGKVTDAVRAMREIGIEKIRSRCCHFDQWLTKLEAQA